jgi:hypothetical protein
VPVEVAVLELHPGALRGLGDEADLDLAGVVRVRLDLPLRVDVPAEHDPVRRFAFQDAGPPALAAVDSPVVDVTAGLGLEHGLGDRCAQQVVFRRLEVAEPRGEEGERPFDRRLDDDLAADHRGCCLGHGVSSLG